MIVIIKILITIMIMMMMMVMMLMLMMVVVMMMLIMVVVMMMMLLMMMMIQLFYGTHIHPLLSFSCFVSFLRCELKSTAKKKKWKMFWKQHFKASPKNCKSLPNSVLICSLKVEKWIRTAKDKALDGNMRLSPSYCHLNSLQAMGCK